MQTPTRKPGQFTHLKADPNITADKYRELEMKLERLKRSQPAAIEEVKRLALMGDFSENAAYQIAKGRLRGINQRIIDIEDHLKRAVIINPAENSDTVRLGSRVTVNADGRERTYLILGPAETDPAKGIISHLSPVGSALMGRKFGETVSVKINGREIKLTILKIQ